MIKWGVASLQLPAKYPQLPALLISQIGTLIWCIDRWEERLHKVYIGSVIPYAFDRIILYMYI